MIVSGVREVVPYVRELFLFDDRLRGGAEIHA
jgi:hypothetical protein